MKIEHIEDLNREELQIFTTVSEVNLLMYNEPAPGIFIAESPYVIMRAIEAGYIPFSMLVEEKRYEKDVPEILKLLQTKYGENITDDLTIYTANEDILKNLTGYALVRGLWAAFKRKKPESFSEFCKGKHRLAVLFDIVNPTNVGAIIRSAAALGIDGVILTHDSVNPLYRRASRVSMGCVFQIPWIMATKTESQGINLIKSLENEGFETAAMALRLDTVSVRDEKVKNAEKLAIVLGTEGFGLPKEIIESCTYSIKIPMYHGVDSLNVAAASAISFWELAKPL
ncbi:MAG: RNA methyltransferase [Lachnospiraceae bacterium]|nr:RNA methyltransferase [Lachnospiraceae bacterium]